MKWVAEPRRKAGGYWSCHEKIRLKHGHYHSSSKGRLSRGREAFAEREQQLEELRSNSQVPQEEPG